jgi:diaminopimelate decarboxylase
MDQYQQYADIAGKYGSPFYIFDREAFAANLRDMGAAFARHYPRTIIGYSYKTNYIPYVCRMARELGAYAEVVSRLEVDLALKLGCPPTEIIFNGPMKTEEDVELALRNNMILNLDTLRELDHVTDFARRHPGAVVNIGLRLNIALVDEEGQSHLQQGVPMGRFGLSPADLEEAAARLRQWPSVRVTSLHGHVSSTSRSLWVYRMIVRTLADAAARYFPEKVDTLDIGGGFFGRRVPAMGLVDTPSYEDYAAAVGEEMHRHLWVVARRPRLIIEPGMAAVADTMSFVTRVFEIKTIGARRLAVVDGTFFNVKPTMHSRNHPFELVCEAQQSGGPETVSVVGATCMEKDCLLHEIEAPPMKRGDFIRIGNVGAYSLVLTPPFIHPAPAILVDGRNGWMAIRRRQNFSDFFNTYSFHEAMETL